MKKQIQKIIGILIIALQISLLAPANISANVSSGSGEKRKFLITGYYSPLPNQSFYVRGSYEADIRLNGRGTNGADGTEVYIGMLAAPRSYPFGTRIMIPGLGVGDVHDRGGAILSGKDYDRIDVWMGRGEEGLARALNWGARIVEGEIYWQAHQIEPGLSFSWISPELPNSVVNRMRSRTVQNPAVFNKPITKTSNKQNIQELQEALIMFGYYHGAIDGIYNDETRKAVLTFQLVEGVIANENDAGAGNFGPKTTATLKKKLEEFNAEVTREIARLQANQEMLISNLGKKSSGEDVVALQRMLWDLGYYHGGLNGKYNEETINSVFDFQTDYKVVENEWDKGAGYYGKKTHTALTSAVYKKMEEVKKYPMEKQTWVPAKRSLPQIASFKSPVVTMARQALSFSPDLMNTKVVQPVAPSQLLTGDFDLNDRNEEVVKLQNILIKNNYLPTGLNTGYFGNMTRSAVLKFQLEKGIVSSEYSPGAGRVGHKTRAALNSF